MCTPVSRVISKRMRGCKENCKGGRPEKARLGKVHGAGPFSFPRLLAKPHQDQARTMLTHEGACSLERILHRPQHDTLAMYKRLAHLLVQMEVVQCG